MVAFPLLVKRYSVDDLACFPQDGKLRELVDGQIVEWPVPTYRQSFFLLTIGAEVRRFAREHRLGQVGGGDGMVRVHGSEFDARGADVAFYQRGRRPTDLDAAATVVVPDFVVEVLSPTDRADMVLDKVHDWLRAGVRLLWYVNPETGTTTVYSGDRIGHVAPDDALNGGDVLPGFQLRIRDILAELDEDEAQP